ncbi:MAG: glycosyltransferase family 4 protein, partial [Bacteroidales bacterium]|nr:glycosyltransferase family 4 protein [Bacteroidales bacterium]
EVKQIPQRKVSNTLDLISVGSLCDRKNQIGILNAVGLLSEEYQKKITVTLVGDGSARLALENKAKELSSKVVFTGSTKEVDKYLANANCFILFSKDEGLPISIIEGMRAGLPVIGTNIAGIPEQIVEGKTGFLVDVDEAQLAERLRYIVDHIDQLPEMGVASYQLFLEKFTIDAMVKKYANIYKSAME